MLARLTCASLRGIEAEEVDVEVDLSRGLPSWTMVGLPDTAVREAKDRVRAALLNSHFEFPLRHITVNLAPADRRKDGSHFDLPVAIGLLMASGQMILEQNSNLPFMVGELALDGRINAVSGVLPLVIFAQSNGFKQVVVPKNNADEASVVEGLEILPVSHLLELVEHLSGKNRIPVHIAKQTNQTVTDEVLDLQDIRGQFQARRALEITAAGGHHLLMSGPPGSGKSMLASRLPGIMPELTSQQRLEVARIYSISGESNRQVHSKTPPFRSPHHSASDVAMIGGGQVPKPGEVSKATHGALFLDELPEFKRPVLEVLRQPLESGMVSIARASETLTFPAKFQLVAAMNPCPCGYFGHPTKNCTCSHAQIHRYSARISGPLLDRFDLRIHVPPVDTDELTRMKPGEPSHQVKERVQAARARQYIRQGEGVLNARLTPTALEMHAKPDVEGAALLKQALNHFNLSARSYHRILKVARTIADLESTDQVTSSHIAEALQYRGEEHQ